MARRRRREVLGALGLLALLTFLLARAWSPMWTIHVVADIALLAYGWAVLNLERGPLPQRGADTAPFSPRTRLAPVLDGAGPRHQPGPRQH